MYATAKDMRFRLKTILEAVDRGEEVYLTYRGKVRALICPVDHEASSVETEPNPFVGMWKDREDMEDVEAYVRRLRQGRFS